MNLGASNMASAPILDYSNNKPTPAVLCSNCGTYCPVLSGTADAGDANQRRLAELEAQVNILKRTASDAGKFLQTSLIPLSPFRK
jgi:hypothetical protein